MNQSKTLTIEVLISLEWFTVQFETDSIERNRLMTVRYNGFLLDTAELPHTHPTYYKEIKKEMSKAAEAHWNTVNETTEEPVKEVISGIPTLDYQSQITKALGLAILILLTSFSSFCQVHVDFGGGIANVTKSSKVSNCIVPVMKISAGYQFSNVVIEWVIQPSLSRIVNTPNYFGAKIGYNVHGFIPSVGMLYDYRSSDESMNQGEIGYALKYQFPVSENGGLYLEGMYTKSSYELTAGFHVVF